MIRAPYQIVRKVPEKVVPAARDIILNIHEIPQIVDEIKALRVQAEQKLAEAEQLSQKVQATINSKLQLFDKKMESLYTIAKGERGIAGKDGKDGQDGSNGVDGLPGINGKDGKNGKDGSAGKDGKSPNPQDIVPHLVKHIQEKKILKIEHITGLQEEIAAYRSQLAGKHYGSDTMVRGGGDTVAAGSGVTIVSVNGVKTISAPAGGSVYTETPTGAVDGVNTSYTVLHSITNVFSFAIGTQFLHKTTDYTISGTTITFVTPLDASLSALPFTITYS